MAELDHWHPIALGRRLGRRPVSVRLAGREIAVFRTPHGVAALDDVCPHRRMRLSAGSVISERLQCPYHGWTFAADGAGESPGTPKLRACTESYETCEAHGAVWLRARGASTDFPEFDVSGYLPAAVSEYRVHVPLELVLDNFCETEHTPTTHGLFGYDLSRMNEVTVACDATETTVRVANAGPAKPAPLPLRVLLGIRKHYHFYDHWTTHFSPVYCVFDHWWGDPATGRENPIRWRVYVFFSPVDETTTTLIAFGYVRSSYRVGPAGGVRPFRWMVRWKLNAEMRADIRLLENLASRETSLAGLKLSRFDKPLALNRERIERVYRGRAAVAVGDGEPAAGKS